MSEKPPLGRHNLSVYVGVEDVDFGIGPVVVRLVKKGTQGRLEPIGTLDLECDHKAKSLVKAGMTGEVLERELPSALQIAVYADPEDSDQEVDRILPRERPSIIPCHSRQPKGNSW